MAQEKMPDGTDAPLEFLPVVENKDCSEQEGGWGQHAMQYPYIWYGNMGEDDWDPDYCKPFYHRTARIESLRMEGVLGAVPDIQGPGGTGEFDVNSTKVTFSHDVIAGGQVCGASFCSASKNFDIPHPTKENKRLVYACLEGPENGVYIRGRLTGNNVIELPDYWRGLVDPESITVSLTQIGSSQDLIVDKIEWGSKVVIRSGSASNIDCYYIVNATRKDLAPLEVEQDVVEGKSYPES
jgi:hypothetical protein